MKTYDVTFIGSGHAAWLCGFNIKTCEVKK